MKLNAISDNPGSTRDRKRVGRGIGSGTDGPSESRGRGELAAANGTCASWRFLLVISGSTMFSGGGTFTAATGTEAADTLGRSPSAPSLRWFPARPFPGHAPLSPYLAF